MGMVLTVATILWRNEVGEYRQVESQAAARSPAREAAWAGPGLSPRCRRRRGGLRGTYFSNIPVSESVGGVVIGSILLGALVFAAAGLYALMAVAAARRTREIGIRIALGANPRGVVRVVFARAG